MILDEVVLHNFGTYRGRQVLKLRPSDRNRPIILIGGLNGRGKTTLLDAIQLALYGKRARCSNRGTLAYEEYLRRSVHKSVPSSEGASVALRFLIHEEGRLTAYDVRRSWTASERAVGEHVEVSRDGHYDRPVSEKWDDEVESMLPLNLSTLFFFDGEKIAELADDRQGTEIIATALSSLLGLELVDRLQGDLLVVERRARAAEMTTKERHEYETLVKQLEESEKATRELTEDRAVTLHDVDRLSVRLTSIEQKIAAEGDDHASAERDRRSTHDALEARVHQLQESLRAHAAGPLPLSLVSHLLTSAAAADASERKRRQQGEFSVELAKRDAHIVDRFAAVASPSAANQLQKLLAADRATRVPEDLGFALQLTEQESAAIRSFPALLADATEHAESTLMELVGSERDLADAARRLEMVPDEDKLQKLFVDRTEARHQLDCARARLLHLEERLATGYRTEADLRSKIKRFENEVVEMTKAQARAARTADFSERVRETLATYKALTLEKQIARIEALILESFQSLIRKSNLISRVGIDPDTLKVTLWDVSSDPLPAERLSAAERQLFAIAMLWGLARASSRPLPTIIDTPLGRLDSVLRESLSRNYFPMASHQTILLSTDEEIDASAHKLIRSYISREYQLVFDDVSKATSIREGYFWETSKDVA